MMLHKPSPLRRWLGAILGDGWRQGTAAELIERKQAEEALAHQASHGVRISIDDFGTGYSSLSRLRHLPVDEIKIDKSFVVDMAASEDDALIVRSIIDLGHHRGLAVVAEGVETPQVRDLLADLGCDMAQGYGVSRPLPATDVARRLQESHWARAPS